MNVVAAVAAAIAVLRSAVSGPWKFTERFLSESPNSNYDSSVVDPAHRSSSSSPLFGREWSEWESRHGRRVGIATWAECLEVERCGDAAEIQLEVRVPSSYFGCD